MNLLGSPRALCSACLVSLLACSPQAIAAQSTPDQSDFRQAVARSDGKPAEHTDATKETPKPQPSSAKPLSLRERAWEILHAGVTFDDTDKRAKAVTALGLLKGNAEAEKLAIAALRDNKGDVRAAAANALGSMHAPHAKAALEAALDDHEPAVVLAAANSLMLIKEADFAYDVYYNVLTGTIRTSNGAIREQIKEQMKILHDKKKIAQLGLEQGVGFIPYGGIGYGVVKTLVKSDNAPVRAAAAKKLAHDPDPATANALVAATQDKNWLVRGAALEAIAERGDRSLVPKVAASLDDDKDDVRYTGAACIARLSALPLKHRVLANAVAVSASAN